MCRSPIRASTKSECIKSVVRGSGSDSALFPWAETSTQVRAFFTVTLRGQLIAVDRSKHESFERARETENDPVFDSSPRPEVREIDDVATARPQLGLLPHTHRRITVTSKVV